MPNLFPSSIAYAFPNIILNARSFVRILTSYIFMVRICEPPRPTSKLENYPFSAARHCLFITFAATPRTGGRILHPQSEEDVQVCTHRYARTCMHAHVCTHMYARTGKHAQVCTHMYARTGMHAQVFTHRYARTGMHFLLNLKHEMAYNTGD